MKGEWPDRAPGVGRLGTDRQPILPEAAGSPYCPERLPETKKGQPTG